MCIKLQTSRVSCPNHHVHQTTNISCIISQSSCASNCNHLVYHIPIIMCIKLQTSCVSYPNHHVHQTTNVLCINLQSNRVSFAKHLVYQPSISSCNILQTSRVSSYRLLKVRYHSSDPTISFSLASGKLWWSVTYPAACSVTCHKRNADLTRSFCLSSAPMHALRL